MSQDGKVNILLVDDQPARLLAYEAILQDLGQNLISARSGTEALERLMQHDFAVVLLDVSMPGMDGFETAGLIHDHPRFERTPIIFVTGVHITDLDRLKGYKLGAVDYVLIPVVPEILRGKVAVLVELHLKRRELQQLNSTLAQANARLAEAHSNLEAEKTRELERLNASLREANAGLEQANHALHNEIRERSRVELQLKEADRHKDEFLAMLAHELRNPLAPIHNSVKLMRLRPMGDPQLEWARDVIGRQAAHLTHLVDDLLDVSRITRGKINIELKPVALAAAVARAVETVQPMLTQQQHELHIDLPEIPLVLVGDLTRVTQVIGNVLGNAVKYTNAGGKIELSGRQDGAAVEVRIRDNGIGIPGSVLPRVFDLFSQAGVVDERSRGGLGIGLALVKRLVDLHDGSVSVSSPGVGLGTEFTIRLPAALAQSEDCPAAGSPIAQPAAPSTCQRRMLLVDDNQDALASLATLLRLAGHDVHTAADGLLALESAPRFLPEIAVLDIGMPGLDGYELARRIRLQPWGQAMVLVALTGWGQENDRRRSHEAGFDSHWVKPLDLDQFMNYLERLDESVNPQTDAAGGSRVRVWPRPIRTAT
ncbi:MAG TPA: response regulator [Steroidobacteraceae bacterium]|jgi:signal transduction histidine kinase